MPDGFWRRIAFSRCWHTLALVLVVAGCGSGNYPVRGHVVWSDGTPAMELAGGSIGFDSVEAGLSARGEIRADATFSLNNLKKDDGLPPGRYRVVVAPPEPIYSNEAPVTSAQEGRRMLSPKYQSYDTSELEATVEAKENEVTVTIEKAQRR